MPLPQRATRTKSSKTSGPDGESVNSRVRGGGEHCGSLEFPHTQISGAPARRIHTPDGWCGTVVRVQLGWELTDALSYVASESGGCVLVDCVSAAPSLGSELMSVLQNLSRHQQRRVVVVMPTSEGACAERLLRHLDDTTACRVGWRVDQLDEHSTATLSSWCGGAIVVGADVFETCVATGNRADLFEIQGVAGRGVMTLAEGNAKGATASWLRGAGVSGWFDPARRVGVAAVHLPTARQVVLTASANSRTAGAEA